MHVVRKIPKNRLTREHRWQILAPHRTPGRVRGRYKKGPSCRSQCWDCKPRTQTDPRRPSTVSRCRSGPTCVGPLPRSLAFLRERSGSPGARLVARSVGRSIPQPPLAMRLRRSRRVSRTRTALAASCPRAKTLPLTNDVADVVAAPVSDRAASRHRSRAAVASMGRAKPMAVSQVGARRATLVRRRLAALAGVRASQGGIHRTSVAGECGVSRSRCL